MSRKGQVSIEILVMISFVILISLVVLVSINEKNLKIEKLRQDLQAKKQAEKLAAAIDTALYNGDGFSMNTTISQYAGSAPLQSFVVYPDAKSIVVTWNDPFNFNESVAVPISTKNVNSISITGNRLNIKNNNSMIVITEY